MGATGTGGGGDSSPNYPWETALKAFGITDYPSRDDVANPAVSGDWLMSGAYCSTTAISTSNMDVVAVLHPLKKSKTDNTPSWYVGFNGNWNGNGDNPGWNSGANKWAHFTSAWTDVMWGLYAGGDNSATSVPSLKSGRYLIDHLSALLAEVKSDVHKVADTLDVEGSDFQGSAAGELKSYLTSFEQAVSVLQLEITLQGNPSDALGTAADGLKAAYKALLDARQAWLTDRGAYQAFNTQASPVPCLRYALNQLILPAHADTSKKTVISNGMDVKSDEFRNAVEALAKKVWRDNVVKYLDADASTAMGNLGLQFTAVSTKLNTRFRVETPTGTAIAPPAPPGPGGDGGGKDGGKGGGGDLGLGGGGGGGNGDLGLGGSGGKGDLGLGGKGGKGGGSHGINGGGPPPPKDGGPLTLDPGGTGGMRVPLLDKDGNKLVGKDGQPLTVPPGSTIDGQGRVIGPDHKPVLGPDGRPLVVPPGTTLGKPAPVVPGGGYFTVPPGSKVDGNGMVIGPDGKPLRDARGNPVYAGKKGTIDKDGRLLDANGKPVTTNDQLFADEEHALNELTTLDPTTGGSGGFDLGSLRGGNRWTDPGSFDLGDGSPGSLGSPGSSGGLRLPGPEVGAPRPETGSGEPLSVTGGFYGGKALTDGGLVNSPEDAATLAAAKKAAAEQALTEKPGPKGPNPAQEEAQLQGRNTATTGGGMPPMMPPGGMGAGAGAQENKERQRTTWLAEDEEVWGTDAGAVSGVIGR
ncbi:hypothetical protein ACFVSN_04390 [Kitasatospora sp. NPDC057904]|uniref:hypothetical protein n=1 Tax=unclassified Kitasatospora TaxID=2633591 RepID=UPI0036DF2A31